jgi:hypothetical protein
VELADKVQETAIEAVWGQTGKGGWPTCLEHPEGEPLGPALVEGRAAWVCRVDGRVVALIGSLGTGDAAD